MSRFVFAGNEIIPGTVIMTADGAVTPKDDLRVILNISGGGNVTVPDGTDTTQRLELVNVSADTCELTYKGTGGSTTASIYTNTGIRLLWVGTYWETSMSTAVTGIDDNSQPFAFNIDSLVKPDGVINLTGTDADGNPFDYGLGKLVTVADEDNYSTSEVKTSKTWIDGKPIYRKVVTSVMPNVTTDGVMANNSYDTGVDDVEYIVSCKGTYTENTNIFSLPRAWSYGTAWQNHYIGVTAQIDSGHNLYVITSSTRTSINGMPMSAILEYTKTTDA